MIRIHPNVSGLLTRGDLHGLREALQAALELEHAVIPPYLYALYSLAPDGSRAVAKIIRSVVDKDMLHLTLAANLLNAVGGRPVLDSPDVLPRYQGLREASAAGVSILPHKPTRIKGILINLWNSPHLFHWENDNDVPAPGKTER
jgi:hypothetical protein